jgi:hypothetical protein
MGPFCCGLLAGIFLGCLLGIFILGLLVAAREDKNELSK